MGRFRRIHWQRTEDHEKKELRDHASLMLDAIADDLDSAQNRLMQTQKSKGLGPRGRDETAAEAHGGDRLEWGFSTIDMVAEFRALRASVIRFWGDENPDMDRIDMVRFNEAVDQALAESVKTYARESEERENLLYSLLRYSFDHNFIMSTDGTLRYVNRAMADMQGKQPFEMIGKRIDEFNPTLAAALRGEFRDGTMNLNNKECRGDITITDAEGNERVIEYRCAPITDSDDQPIAIVGITRDVTERAESERTLWRQANYDALTEAPNRRLFFDRLDHDMKQAKRNGTRLALLYIDLDKFKAANDRLGHSLGDQLLKGAAQRINACIRETDTLARLGGDEFTVLLTNLDNEEQAALLAGEILKQLVEPFSLDGEVAHISGSIGIAFFPEDGATVDALASKADNAMYTAKDHGGNQFHFYQPTDHESGKHPGQDVHRNTRH
ncbi:MAG: GGDEF domain-containing protein [Proteobacteria bacterium]|nr:GGDEF domain-containing protein [Pseudomonadota bacterium]